MARTVVAIYDNFQMANDAVRELVDSGFPRDNISIIANNQRGEFGNTSSSTTTTRQADNVADETGAGAGVGAGIGAAIGGIGGLLVGLGALTIPGIGPVIAAGPLAVALSTLTGAGVGAVAGGVTGGLLGALVGLGVPEEEAGYYAEGVRRGGVLVTVQADDYNTDQITSILNRHDPIDINARAEEWRSTGWTGYDPNARTIPSTGSTSTRTDQGMGTGTMDRDSEMFDRTRTDRDYSSSSTFTDRSRMDMNTGYYEGFDPEYSSYRTFYDTYLFDTGQPYSFYVPAYRFGYGLRNDPRYQNRDWTYVEPMARQDWERDNPGTWERMKRAVRHAWETIVD